MNDVFCDIYHNNNINIVILNYLCVFLFSVIYYLFYVLLFILLVILCAFEIIIIVFQKQLFLIVFILVHWCLSDIN